MKAYIILAVSLVALSTASDSLAQTDLVLGARPQGLGGAYVALADDANGVYWNPAGLARVEHRELTFMHWIFSDVSELMVDYGALAQRLGSGTIGLSWTRQGAELEQGPDGEESTMSINQFLVAYGFPLGNRFSMGIGLNRTVIRSNAPTNAGLAFDFGVLLQPTSKASWTLGFNAKNLGGNDVLTPYYIAGTALTLPWKKQHITAAVDGRTQDDIQGREDLSVKYNAGLEYGVTFDDYEFALRSGINSRSYSFGGGLGFYGVVIDYAYVLMQETTIGDSHKFALTYTFSK